MADTIEQLVVRWTDAEEIRLRAGEIDTETMRTVLAVTRGFAAQVLEWNDDRMLNDIGGVDRATVLRDVPTTAGVRHDVLRALARRRRALDVLDEDLTALETRFEAEAAAALVRDDRMLKDIGLSQSDASAQGRATVLRDLLRALARRRPHFFLDKS